MENNIKTDTKEIKMKRTADHYCHLQNECMSVSTMFVICREVLDLMILGVIG